MARLRFNRLWKRGERESENSAENRNRHRARRRAGIELSKRIEATAGRFILDAVRHLEKCIRVAVSFTEQKIRVKVIVRISMTLIQRDFRINKGNNSSLDPRTLFISALSLSAQLNRAAEPAAKLDCQSRAPHTWIKWKTANNSSV